MRKFIAKPNKGVLWSWNQLFLYLYSCIIDIKEALQIRELEDQGFAVCTPNWKIQPD